MRITFGPGIELVIWLSAPPVFFTRHGNLPQDLTKKIIALSYEKYGKSSLI